MWPSIPTPTHSSLAYILDGNRSVRVHVCGFVLPQYRGPEACVPPPSFSTYPSTRPFFEHEPNFEPIEHNIRDASLGFDDLPEPSQGQLDPPTTVVTNVWENVFRSKPITKTAEYSAHTLSFYPFPFIPFNVFFSCSVLLLSLAMINKPDKNTAGPGPIRPRPPRSGERSTRRWIVDTATFAATVSTVEGLYGTLGPIPIVRTFNPRPCNQQRVKSLAGQPLTNRGEGEANIFG